MKQYQRQSKFTELRPYDHLAKESDFMEVTEWHNGEGFDVTMSDNKSFSLTWGELTALTVLVNYKE
jgi:hypothetical protein